MRTLDDASLSPVERRVLDRLVGLLEQEYGNDLRSIWLFGSRARGEDPGPESDVDVLVVLRGAQLEDQFRVIELVHKVADAEGGNPAFFAVKVYDTERIAQRREIRSFFMQEVDRDKVVLAGEP